MKYKQYAASDFVKDEYFVQWIINPNPERNFFWKEWLKQNPEKFEEVQNAKQIISSFKYKNQYTLSDQELNDIFHNVISTSSKKRGSVKLIPKKLLKIAAAISLIILSAVALFNYFDPVVLDNQSAHLAPNIIEKSTLTGQKKTIKLPDGSLVSLNYTSKILYPQEFDKEVRKVYLSGEAFFEVVSNPDQPFIIQTGSLQTKVLGTSFNVQSWNDQSEIRVTVVSGKVQISEPKGEYSILTPSEMGIFHKSDNSISRKKVDLNRHISWKNGIIHFVNEPLDHVFKKLEKWYGVKIKVLNQDKITGRFSGEFDNESLETVLKGIGFTSGFEFKINDDEVTIN